MDSSTAGTTCWHRAEFQQAGSACLSTLLPPLQPNRPLHPNYIQPRLGEAAVTFCPSWPRSPASASGGRLQPFCSLCCTNSCRELNSDRQRPHLCTSSSSAGKTVSAGPGHGPRDAGWGQGEGSSVCSVCSPLPAPAGPAQRTGHGIASRRAGAAPQPLPAPRNPQHRRSAPLTGRACWRRAGPSRPGTRTPRGLPPRCQHRPGARTHRAAPPPGLAVPAGALSGRYLARRRAARGR